MKLGYLSTLKTVGTLSTKIAIVAAASIGGASLVSSSVFAALTASATNTTATAVTSGYMSLTQAPGAAFGGASGGFTTAITAMAPLDSVVRLVTLTNSSTLNAASMTVKVTDATPTVLTTDGTIGLQALIQQCTVAYAQASAGAAYTCSGTETSVRAASSILSLATPQALTLIPASLLASGVSYLKVTISLPDSTENTLNGAVAGAGSIQSKTAGLTWTVAATQRTATTTNS